MHRDLVQRYLCPSCLCAGGECDRCNGSGYVWVSPYAEGRGEQGLGVDELELGRLRAVLVRLNAELKRLAAPVVCPCCGAEIERRAA